MTELLGRAEYVHVLVNPVLTHALPLAALALAVALAARSPGAVRLALLLVVLSAGAVWPAVHYGRAGFDRVQAMADETGGDWLSLHRYRAERWAWTFYATAAAAAAALAIPRRRARAASVAAGLALAAAVAASALAAYIAYPAGKVRHREFRTGAPPDAELRAAHAAENGP